MKCSVFIATSLDGFIARTDGGLDWLPAGGESGAGEDYGYQEFFDSIDTLVMGRNTYDLARSFREWPYHGKKVVVLSSRYPETLTRLTDEVEAAGCSPARLVSQLSDRGARHLYVDGGRTIQGFLGAGLIDDMTITRIPILLGEGIPLFGRLASDIRLQHLETRAFKDGLVQSRYRVRASVLE